MLTKGSWSRAPFSAKDDSQGSRSRGMREIIKPDGFWQGLLSEMKPRGEPTPAVIWGWGAGRDTNNKDHPWPEWGGGDIPVLEDKLDKCGEQTGPGGGHAAAAGKCARAGPGGKCVHVFAKHGGAGQGRNRMGFRLFK